MNFSHRLTAALAFGWILAVNSTLTNTATAQSPLEVSQLSQQSSLTPPELNGSPLLDKNSLLIEIHGLDFDEQGRASYAIPINTYKELAGINDERSQLVASPVISTTDAEAEKHIPNSQVNSLDEAQQIVEDNGIRFELKGCNRSGQSVKCKFTLSNQSNDRKLTLIPGKTRMIDFSGNEYFSTSIQSKYFYFSTGIQYSNQSGSSSDWRNRSQEKISIYFLEIPTEIREIAALKLVYTRPSLSGHYTVKFRNIILE
ncbi:MAG: hypothetical protein QNJ53_17175 [Pleurocapsa sp. MO_192.B19]|nr:hypothetical protein [Pleurocapsa sp. MO_192.B19]